MWLVLFIAHINYDHKWELCDCSDDASRASIHYFHFQVALYPSMCTSCLRTGLLATPSTATNLTLQNFVRRDQSTASPMAYSAVHRGRFGSDFEQYTALLDYVSYGECVSCPS